MPTKKRPAQPEALHAKARALLKALWAELESTDIASIPFDATLTPQLALLGWGDLGCSCQRLGGFFAAIDALSETNFVVLGQQVVPPNVLEVEPDQILVFTSVETVVSHKFPFPPSSAGSIPSPVLVNSWMRRA